MEDWEVKNGERQVKILFQRDHADDEDGSPFNDADLVEAGL